MDRAVILIGHGGVPSDIPGELIKELKMLESQRMAKKLPQMTPREAELDKQVREWPRTKNTDPYKSGLEAIAEKLREKLNDSKLVTAYNEFCAPSVEDAIKTLAEENFEKIVLMTTMYTPGGLHSEIEIPQIVLDSRKRYPSISFEYLWPFDTEDIAVFLSKHLQRKYKNWK